MKYTKSDRRSFIKTAIGAIATALVFNKLELNDTQSEPPKAIDTGKEVNSITDFIQKHIKLGSLVTISGGPNAVAAKLALATSAANRFIDERNGELIVTENIDRPGMLQALKTRRADTVWIIESNEITQNDWYGSDQGSKLVDFARENSLAIILTLMNNSTHEGVTSIKIEDGMCMGTIPFLRFVG